MLYRVLAWLWVARAGLTSIELQALASAHFPLASSEHVHRVLRAALLPSRMADRSEVRPMSLSTVRPSTPSTDRQLRRCI
jgi:hypothetical protein